MVNPRPPIQERFEQFHNDNPHVYEMLVRLARTAKESGATKIGFKMLWERMRWEFLVVTKDKSGYKLNNDYHSRYARLLMEREEDLRGVFETRVLRA